MTATPSRHCAILDLEFREATTVTALRSDATMPTKTQDRKSSNAPSSEYRATPIFSRARTDGTIEFSSHVPTACRTYTFKADSLREIQVKIDIALDTP